MGHIVNSVSYRLGNNRYYNNSWFIYNKSNYSYIANQDILIQRLLSRIFKYKKVALNGIILSNIKILRAFKNTNIYVYVHDSRFELLIYDLKSQQRKIFKLLSKKAIKINKKFFLKVSRRSKFYDLKINCIFYWFLIEHVIRPAWHKLKHFLLLSIKYLLNKNVNLYLIGLSRIAISANIVAEFIRIRLKQYYTIWEILRNVNYLFKTMMKKGIVFGYKIACSGRFSRKQRTTYSWKTVGKLGPASVKARLDYSYRTLVLKYSVCTIKVWIRLGSYVKNNLIEFII